MDWSIGWFGCVSWSLRLTMKSLDLISWFGETDSLIPSLRLREAADQRTATFDDGNPGGKLIEYANLTNNKLSIISNCVPSYQFHLSISKYNYYSYWVPLSCFHRNPLSCFFRSEISHLTVGPCRCLRGRRALEQLSIGRLRRLPKARERERREINDVIFNALLKMVENGQTCIANSENHVCMFAYEWNHRRHQCIVCLPRIDFDVSRDATVNHAVLLVGYGHDSSASKMQSVESTHDTVVSFSHLAIARWKRTIG